jgi:acyl-[acyl carrier protein]--UDP-N-acetylglucosamine O-acyltransferase
MPQNIHPTAIIDPSAQIHESTSIGPYTIIHQGVVVQEGTVIGSHCELGHPMFGSDPTKVNPLIIGRNSIIRSHSVFYAGSQFGENLATGHRVTVRENTKAGRNVQIGTLSDIQGHCEIGNFVKTHSNVHIGQGSKIEDFVWLFPYVVLTNDPHPPSHVCMGVTIEKYAVVATMSVVLPGIVIHEGALVGAHSSVTKDVPEIRLWSAPPQK